MNNLIWSVLLAKQVGSQTRSVRTNEIFKEKSEEINTPQQNREEMKFLLFSSKIPSLVGLLVFIVIPSFQSLTQTLPNVVCKAASSLATIKHAG